MKIRIFIILLMFNDCLTANMKFQNWVYESSNGLLCQLCPVGKFLIKPCEKDGGESMCSICPRGTFTSSANNATECGECTICRIAQYQKSPCTGTRDRVCECPPGLFWVRYRGHDGICLHHTKCKEGEVVDVEGTQTSDTTCKKAPPTTPTLKTVFTTVRARSAETTASKDKSRTTDPILTEPLDAENTIPNNGIKPELYHFFKLGRNHNKHLKHIGVHRLSKPKHINTGISTESHQHKMVDTRTNEASVDVPANDNTAPANEATVNTPADEAKDNAPVKTVVDANDTNSYNNPHENGKNLSTKETIPYNVIQAILPNGMYGTTQNPQMQVPSKPSTTTSGGRRRKHKRGKGKKLRRRKKNKKNKKNGRIRKCRHKVEKKRQKCERRRKRVRHRNKKSQKQIEVVMDRITKASF